MGAVLERIARETSGCANAYAVPFSARRPPLARGMLRWALLSAPFFLVALGPFLAGVVAPGLVFCGLGALCLWVGVRLHAQEPVELSVTHDGLAVTRAEGRRHVAPGQLTELRLGASKAQPPRAVLQVSGGELEPLAIDLVWAEPVRLFALLDRLREEARRPPRGEAPG